MKRKNAFFTGTAIATMAATYALAGTPLRGIHQQPDPGQILLAQSEQIDEQKLLLEQQQQPEAAPQQEAAPPPEEAPPPAEEAPPPVEEAPPPPPAEEAAPPPEPGPAPAEQVPAPQPEPQQPAAEQEAPPAPAAEQPAPETPAEQQPAVEQPAPPPPAPESAPAEQPAAPEQPPASEQTQPAPEAAPAEQPAPQPEAPQPPAESGQQPAGVQPATPAEQPAESTQPAQTPFLDSQKPQPGAAEGAPAPEAPAQGAKPAEPAPPPPASDAEAQPKPPAEIESATREEGRRVRRAPEERQRERPKGAEVLRELGDRIIIELGGGQVVVESSDRPRMTRGAREVYYEDLPRGRTRETVERRDGTRVVTIRNAYGDVIRRSRITPDGREYVLVYVEEDDFDRVRDWRDPGLDLPPLRLDMPEDEYILDSRRARDAEAYYDFLDQPPVERVERLYSVDEVKRSARIRDKVRRVDLDTVNFDFGSASISESEIAKLDNVAAAMERMLRQNPAETFLIEGHTDAVGSDLANLALSDRRAEAVADALTNVFDIPPENLATQGYGEQYLKVRTSTPERVNRRVAIRRITPLVAP
ncbi:MAG: OmpA family protein, partial [Rhizobiaceae bacterium]|nr:OmpA family protein [Rhizobiaceae bacterium]